MLAEIFGPDLLIVVIVIAVLIFGGAAIPKLARNLGSAQGEFKKGLSASKESSDQDAKATDVPPNSATPDGAKTPTDGNNAASS